MFKLAELSKASIRVWFLSLTQTRSQLNYSFLSLVRSEAVTRAVDSGFLYAKSSHAIQLLTKSVCHLAQRCVCGFGRGCL